MTCTTVHNANLIILKINVDSIPATLSGDGTERLENSYTELWNTKEGGQDAKCPGHCSVLFKI